MLVEILVSFYANTAHYIFFGMGVVYLYAAAPPLAPDRVDGQQQGGGAKYPSNSHSSYLIILQR